MAEPTRIGELLGSSIGEGLLPPGLLETWREVCPSRLRAVVMPVKLEGGRLVVGVAGAPARQELVMITPAILKALRGAGWRLEGLRIVNLPTPPHPPPPPPPQRTPSPEELKRARALAGKVSDPALARRVYSAIVAQLRRG